MEDCTMCGGENEEVDFGFYKGFRWSHAKCTECEHEESTEPEYDSMFGGHDDY